MNKTWPQIVAFLQKYLTLCGLLVFMNLKKEQKDYVLGAVWWILEPLFFCMIYYIFFVEILGTHDRDFLPVLLFCLITWRWFTLTIVGGMSSIVQSVSFIRNNDLPKAIFPLQKAIFEAIRYSVAMLIALGLYAVLYQFSLLQAAQMALYVLIAFIFVLAVALILSALLVFVPDIKKSMPLVMRGLLLFSGVFFDASRIPEQLQIFYYLNPFAILMETLRAILFESAYPPAIYFAYVAVVTVLLFIIGVYMQYRFNRTIPRYLL